MFLIQDNTQAQEFGLVRDGNYEVVATDKRIFTSNSGTQGVEFVFEIRHDVPQEFKGRKIYHTFWCTPKTMPMIHGFNKLLGVPHGHKFETIEDWADYVIGEPIIAKIKTTSYTYNGETKEKNEIGGFAVTKFPDIVAGGEDSLDFDESDLPF